MPKQSLSFGVAVLVLLAMAGSSAADDPRYTMKVCKRDGPCAFVLDTETGEVRFCDPDGCRVLDTGAPVDRPSPFPFAEQGSAPGPSGEPFPLGEATDTQPSVLEQLERPPAAGGPSPFPFVEPAPRSQ